MTRPGLARGASLLTALAIVLGGLAVPHAAEPSFIWRVTRDGGTFFLVGSVHMLRPQDYPVSEAMESAFASSDLLVEEVDYREMMAPESQMQMIGCLFWVKL